MLHWLPLFSHDKKRRFLSAVAKFTQFVDIAEWMDILHYDKFDLLMFVNPRCIDAIVRSLVSWLKGDGKAALENIDSWIDYDVGEIITILCQSAYMTPALERYLLP